MQGESLRAWPLRAQLAYVRAARRVFGISHENAISARVQNRDSSPLENQTPRHLTPLKTARAVHEVTDGKISLHLINS